MSRDIYGNDEKFVDQVTERIIAKASKDDEFLINLVTHLINLVPNVVENAVDYITEENK